MKIFDLSILFLIAGGSFMILGILLILVFFLAYWLSFSNKSNNTLIDKIFKAGNFSIQFGLFIFFLSLAMLLLGITIEGLINGKYILSFGRTNPTKTIITWEEKPVRFVFQTIIFIVFSVWSIRFVIK
ncbi:hypothetical protein PQ459_16665 [Chryseobacterium sp. KACC 21268]|nr:hypothetical protein PQ459_16665 [Chryseobacterium sp. KACC 21268]